MNKDREMRRLSVYIDKNLVNDLQKLAEKERRSVSFLISDLLQKAVNRKINAQKGSI